MASRKKNYHAGGTQVPMFVSESAWVPPHELPDLRALPEIAVDVETRDDGLAGGHGPGWAHGAGHVCGFSAAWDGGSLYAPVRHPDTACLDEDAARRWVDDHAAAGVKFVFHNASYDLGWLRRWGCARTPSAIDDTMGMAVVVDENRREYSLDATAAWRGLPGKDETLLREAAASYCVDPKSELWKLPARYVGRYAEQDAVAALALARSLRPEVEAQGLSEPYQTEMDLVPLVLEMRWRGVRVDLDAAERAVASIRARRDAALAELASCLGRSAATIDQVRSVRWMEETFAQESLPFPRTGKTRQGSFKAEWMRGHAHWLPRLASLAIQMEDAAGKFVENFIVGYAHRGRLHASVNQYRGEYGGTRSFRFSYSDPPLQEMPARDEDLAPMIRGVFVPEDGERWASADYNQQEYRLIVHFSELLKLSAADRAGDKYRSDPRTDFHQLVMDWTGLARKPAKNLNFAKSYGAGIGKLALMLGKSKDEARELDALYDRELPFVDQLGDRCDKVARRRGYVRLIDGARCHFDDWEPASHWSEEEQRYVREAPGYPRRRAEALLAWPGLRLVRSDTRKAGNRLVQGSAARQTKIAMRACWREGLVPLLQMHDELCFSIGKKSDGDRVGEIMREAVALTIPVLVDVEYGASWGDAHHEWEDAA